jgi:DNA-binding response OmpR family regulator
MRVLVIEDDRKAARLLAKGLREEGFVVDVAATGEDGEESAAVNEYDVIVLDWRLPGKDGLAVCRALRAQDVSTPILMLTARDGIADRVNGLRTGADDYLTKPFAFDELLARITALLRRSRVAQPAVLKVGDLTLDPARRRVSAQACSSASLRRNTRSSRGWCAMPARSSAARASPSASGTRHPTSSTTSSTPT